MIRLCEGYLGGSWGGLARYNWPLELYTSARPLGRLSWRLLGRVGQVCNWHPGGIYLCFTFVRAIFEVFVWGLARCITDPLESYMPLVRPYEGYLEGSWRGAGRVCKWTPEFLYLYTSVWPLGELSWRRLGGIGQVYNWLPGFIIPLFGPWEGYLGGSWEGLARYDARVCLSWASEDSRELIPSSFWVPKAKMASCLAQLEP